MIGKLEFDALFDKLLRNPWEFFPEKYRIEGTRKLYYDELKHYPFKIVDAAFREFVKGENKYMPILSRVIVKIEHLMEDKDYLNLKKTPVPVKLRDLRNERDSKTKVAFSSCMKEARKILDLFGNDRAKLTSCGKKWNKIRQDINRDYPQLYKTSLKLSLIHI